MERAIGRFEESFLRERFHGFYAELVRLKHVALRDGRSLAEPLPRGAAAGTGDGSDVARAINRRLLTILEQDAIDAVQQGGAMGGRLFQEALYIMAVLADEIFLHEIEWNGKTVWKSMLLESQIFQSYQGGDKFFDNLDALLLRRDPLTKEIACIYLFALQLGFRGRYRGGSEEVISRYKVELYRFIANRAPDLADASRRFFADAYERTLDAGIPRRLPHLRRWALALAAVIAVFIVVQHLTWMHLTQPLFAVLDRNL